MSLTSLSMRRPVTTLMVFVCLVLFGALSVRWIPLELFPEFDAPVLFVQLPYGGSTPEEVERQITRPAEEALATISSVKRMTSTSYENRSEVVLRFDWGTDTDIKAVEVREKLDGIANQLPRDMERPFVGQFSTADMPILQLRLSSGRDLSGAYELLDRKLKRPIERIDGVSQVELQGVAPREVRIELKADRVAAHRVDLVRLAEILRRSDLFRTAGRVTDGGSRFVVRPVSSLTTLEDLRDVVVTDAGVRLRDVADVVLDTPDLDHGRHLNRTYAVGLSVSKEAGANTVAVAEQVEAAVAALDGDPEMRGINVYVMDSSAEGITSSLRDLLIAGLLGGVFAIVVLFFFLRRVSTTLIVALAVPISILVTVGVMYALGLSLNVLSLMGLMLAVGMLVDNAVVVTENIHRHQHLAPDDRVGATKRGVKEVGLAVTAGTLTTATVFLPMIVSQADQVTLFLKHVSIAICVALGVSLLISLTVVPLLTARLDPPTPDSESRWIRALTERYRRLLDGLLRRRALAGGLTVAILASVIVPAGLVKQDFFPNDNTSREIRLFYHVNDTYTVDRVEEAVSRVEDVLFAHRDDLEIESVYSYYRANYAASTILLTDAGETPVEDLQERIRERLPRLTIADPSFTWENDESGSSIRLTLAGSSSDVLRDLSRQVARVLDRVDGLSDVRSEATLGEKEVRVVVDRLRARQQGLSSDQVGRTVAAAMRGQPLRRFRTADGEVEMRLLFQDADRQSLDELRTLPIQRASASEDGPAQVPLGALADLEVVRGAQSIQRENRSTMVGVTAGLGDLTTPEARKRIEAAMAGVQLPAGYTWGFGQRIQEEEESQNVMMMNLLLALALIYLVMASLFESLIHPAAIWTSIVFAVVGVFWFFLLTSTTFSLMAWIGILILIGVVVNNGIVLIDHINFLRGQGLRRHAAVVRAGAERLRPILMTAATTILGLIPLCLGTTQVGGDGPAYFPMARAIVGGLAFSTVITLVILPAVYLFFDDLRRWGRRLAGSAGGKSVVSQG
jgi:HAE1 family hydrophobic/amphiphilic exporter-1